MPFWFRPILMKRNSNFARMDFFLKACSIGFLLSVMMGPVFFILIETSIRRGIRAAVAFDLGVLISDAIYILFAKIFIIEVTLIDTTENKILFAFIGGGLFMVYGVYNFFKKYQISDQPNEESYDPEKKDYLKLFLKGFLLNFANPLVIFYWFSVITLANQSIGTAEGEFKQFVFLGVILVTFFLFDLLKIIGAKQLKPLMTPFLFKQMNRLIGIVFFLFGLFLILQNLNLKALINQVSI